MFVLITFVQGGQKCVDWYRVHTELNKDFSSVKAEVEYAVETAKQQLAIQIHKMFPLKWALHHNVNQVTSYFRGKHEDSTPDNQHIHQPQISVSSIVCKSRSNTRRSKDHNFKKPKPSTGFPFMIYFSFLWSQSCLGKALSGYLHCCLFLLLIIDLPGLFSHWPCYSCLD